MHAIAFVAEKFHIVFGDDIRFSKEDAVAFAPLQEIAHRR